MLGVCQNYKLDQLYNNFFFYTYDNIPCVPNKIGLTWKFNFFLGKSVPLILDLTNCK